MPNQHSSKFTYHPSQPYASHTWSNFLDSLKTQDGEHRTARELPFCLTISDVQRELQASRAFVYKLAERKPGLLMIRMGRSVRIPRASLEAYVRELSDLAEQGSTAEEGVA